MDGLEIQETDRKRIPEEALVCQCSGQLRIEARDASPIRRLWDLRLIESAEESRYSIAKATGVSESSLSQFMAETKGL